MCYLHTIPKLYQYASTDKTTNIQDLSRLELTNDPPVYMYF